MTEQERDILIFLKATPKVFYSAREIARRTCTKELRHEMPPWVKEFLQRLVNKEVLETDPAGHYRIKPRPEVKAGGRKWVSPQIASLLKKHSHADFGKVVVTEIKEEDLEDLNL